MKPIHAAILLFILSYGCRDKYSGAAGTPSDTTSIKYADTTGRQRIPNPPANKFNGRRDSIYAGSDSIQAEYRDSMNRKKAK